jgi:hypothetical protein
MRMFLGIILGVVLTIGGAFIIDGLRPAAGPDGVEVKPMVNWDVVADKCKAVSIAVQDGWNRLTGRAT